MQRKLTAEEVVRHISVHLSKTGVIIPPPESIPEGLLYTREEADRLAKDVVDYIETALKLS
ncbi:hypothetical protein [Agathobaculum desmolans]|uniref:hypothetical protein n=1 Tax=Agathobaculum desmolans TaxID=39484 RepID=UPI00248F0C23|nr:hypothetical protein [Agathobaculum desmolans]